MPSTSKKVATSPSRRTKSPPLAKQVEAAVAELKRLANKKTLVGMTRFAIPNENAFGVPVGKIRALGKELKKNLAGGRGEPNHGAHELAAALWPTGWYETRMLCSFLDDPALVTPAQMDAWCSDFDSWAICDTLCFHLFDRTPHAFRKVRQWSDKQREFVKRGAFALLASIALHDKATDDGPFFECLPLIERAANDGRNFVKKGVSWALRGVGRRSAALHAESVALARRLADSTNPTERWVGKEVLRDITKSALMRKIAAKHG